MSDTLSLIAKINKMSIPECEAHLSAYALVQGFFKDHKKTSDWYEASNPMLGGTKPIDMIKQGCSEKLLKFVQEMLKENKHD